jgi:site-specific recombinase XerD
MKKLQYNSQLEQKFLESGIDEKTLQSYKSWYDQLYKFCDYELLDSVKFETIVAFFDFLENNKGYSPPTLHGAMTAIRYLYLKIFNIKYSFEKIKLPRIEREIPISIGKNALKLLFDSIINPKQKVILTLIYSAGLDIKEVAYIKAEDVQNGQLTVRNSNNKIVRKTILGEYVLELLRNYQMIYKPKKYLFEGQNDSSPYTESSIRNAFNQAKKKCGIAVEITTKHLKYSYVKHLQDEGYKTIDILRHLNLSSGQTIEYYSQIDNEIQEINYSPIDSIYGKKQPKSIQIEVTNEQLENIVFTDSQTKQLIEKNPALIKSFIENDLSHSDIIALGYRKTQLERFRKLLFDDEYFDLEKSTYNIQKNEQVWQSFFESNPWIFGHGLNYLFSTPLDDKKLEQVVSGYDFNSGGKRVDGLLKTRGIISSLCFVEIKTHKTDLLKANSYRIESWSVSDELTGAIAQIQRTVDKSLRTISAKVEIKDKNGNLTGEQVFLYQPKSYLILGSLSEFRNQFGVNEEKYSSFEIFRRNIINPEILTFDELYERARFIVENMK